MKPEILFINVGTPNDSSEKSVGKYLIEFLLDKRVIPLPWIFRQILVRFLIVPFRKKKSASLYSKIWMKEGGSPLQFYSKKFVEKMQSEWKGEANVSYAMCYQSPALKNELQKIMQKQPKCLVVVPLFPHYASVTTGGALEIVQRYFIHSLYVPNLYFLHTFYRENFYIQALSDGLQKRLKEISFDVLLFSYHGLPEKQMKETSENRCSCIGNSCEKEIEGCYRSQCFATSRLLAERLNLKESEYCTSFQSRLGRSQWIMPYTENIILELRSKNVTNIAVTSPSFVMDCLETLEEINIGLRKKWENAGGQNFYFIPCLNDNDDFVKGMKDFIADKIK